MSGDLVSYFKNSHTLQQKFKMTLTEINNMIPWHLDVRMELLLQDQEKEKEAARKQQGPQW